MTVYKQLKIEKIRKKTNDELKEKEKSVKKQNIFREEDERTEDDYISET